MVSLALYRNQDISTDRNLENTIASISWGQMLRNVDADRTRYPKCDMV